MQQRHLLVDLTDCHMVSFLGVVLMTQDMGVAQSKGCVALG